jgi:catechol 2,3-dioxygenase-like lactoylglutathione lyase family enzyme
MEVGIMCVVLDSDDSEKLSDFYHKLLGWEITKHDEWYILYDKSKEGRPWLLFQETENYERPVWPNVPGKQQQMTHLDFHVDNIDESVKHAIACGAELSGVQLADAWRVMLDPAGHPFCICANPVPPSE